MVKNLSEDEYNRMMGIVPKPAPVEPAPPVQELGTNGSAPVKSIESQLDDEDLAIIAMDDDEPVVVEDDSQIFDSYTKKFVKQEWQIIDIFHLLRSFERGGASSPNAGTANWSEMGCFKTSTGLWYSERMINEAITANKLKNAKAPSILIVTSKGGKGTYFEAIPEILPEWTIINIETQQLFVLMNGQMLPLPKDTHKFVPKEFTMPTVCIAHYDIFSRSNHGKFETDNEGNPIQIDGKFIFKEPLQSDHIANREWDIMICDEFHRLKDRNARWTVNIKRVKTRIGRHGMTGTGFINRPDEIWSLLNWLDKSRFGSFNKFKEVFCEIDTGDDGYARVMGCKPEMQDAFRALVRDIGVRRTLDGVMPHIKRPVFVPIDVDLNKEQRRMYDAIRMDLKALDQAGTPLYAANVLTLLQR
jgi:hypothetical protein